MSYLPKTILAALLLSSSWQLTAARDIIDLSGEWSYILVNAPAEIPAEGVLSLPGTLDTNNVGIPVPVSDNTSQLSRKVTYTGNASYSRDISIPESWSGKSVILSLERTRPATVFIDGKRISSSSLISAPQRHDLSGNLTPGKHTIEIVVNNGDSIPLTVRNNSHACTESTQTNWNGIIGKMQLTACDPLHIVSATPFPQPRAGSRRIDITLSQPAPKGFVIAAECGDNRVEEKIDSDTTRFSIMMPASAPEYYWSEWNPQTEVVRVSLHVCLIHISEPTRLLSSGYGVLCL